jgi:peptidyl-prolyl cis-trans isomerase A (cyclophilin A)
MLNHPQPDGHGYAVFGKVVKGMDTVEAIKSVKTGSSGMHRDVPAEQVLIQSIARVGAK